MRLRSILLLTLFHFLVCSLIGQGADKVEVYVGPELEEQRGNSIWKTFGHSDDFFFCLRSDRRKNDQFLIEKIDVDSLSIIKTLPLSLEAVGGKIPVLAYPMSTANASYLIATAEDPGGSDIYIMAYQISDELEIKREPIVIGIGDREALLSENGFITFKSDDEKKVALFIPKEKDPILNEKFELRYFDSQLNLLDTKKIELPYPSANILLADVVLTPDGVFHGVISIRKESEVRVLPDSYALLTYHPAEDRVKEKALSLGNKWFYDVNLTVTPDTNLWLSGYYSNMVEPSMVGTFSVVIDSNTGELINTGLSSFEREFRLMFRQDLKSDEDDLGLFKIDKSYLKNKGSLSLISEKRFSRQSTIYEPSTRMYTTIQVHYNEEILVTTIRPSSKIVENILIPKYQSSYRQYGRYTSYVSAQWGENLLFFYNDHTRNESLSPTDYNEYRSLNNENNINITYCLVSGGTITKRSLKTELTNDYYLDAEQVYRSSKGLILTTYKGYKTKYLKVTAP